MDEECFPTVSMSSACGRLSETVTVKDEPVSETDSMHSSCPPSPQSNFLHLTESMDTEVVSHNKKKIFCTKKKISYKNYTNTKTNTTFLTIFFLLCLVSAESTKTQQNIANNDNRWQHTIHNATNSKIKYKSRTGFSVSSATDTALM